MKVSERMTVAVDFDGVLHSYISPWKNAWTIQDPPIPGAMAWLREISQHYRVAINSARCANFFGRRAMHSWIWRHLNEEMWSWAANQGLLAHNFTHMDDEEEVRIMTNERMRGIFFPRVKPHALIYLDDRAIRFAGVWPTLKDIQTARPWKVGEADKSPAPVWR